jgi:hypothetical protein
MPAVPQCDIECDTYRAEGASQLGVSDITLDSNIWHRTWEQSSLSDTECCSSGE